MVKILLRLTLLNLASAIVCTPLPVVAANANPHHCEAPDIIGGKLIFSRFGTTDRTAFAFDLDDFLTAKDGPRYKFRLFGDFDKGASKDNIQADIDNTIITLQFDADKHASGPALLYITRNNYIPIDLAPAKLWYPEYYKNRKLLEMTISLGDLDRVMQLGPFQESATTLTWILNSIPQKAFDDEVIASGEIPLAPIWSTRKTIEDALKKCLTKP